MHGLQVKIYFHSLHTHGDTIIYNHYMIKFTIQLVRFENMLRCNNICSYAPKKSLDKVLIVMIQEGKVSFLIKT